MEKRANTVELYNSAEQRKESFEINHAERILRFPNNGGWELPEDSQYKFNVNDGITIKRGSNNTERTEK